MLVLFILAGVRRHSKLEKTCEKHRNHLSTKLIKSLWLLAIFQLNDVEEFFDSI